MPYLLQINEIFSEQILHPLTARCDAELSSESLVLCSIYKSQLSGPCLGEETVLEQHIQVTQIMTWFRPECKPFASKPNICRKERVHLREPRLPESKSLYSRVSPRKSPASPLDGRFAHA